MDALWEMQFLTSSEQSQLLFSSRPPLASKALVPTHDARDEPLARSASFKPQRRTAQGVGTAYSESCYYHRPCFDAFPNWRIGGSARVVEGDVRAHLIADIQLDVARERRRWVGKFLQRACSPALVSYMTNIKGSDEVCFSSQYLWKTMSLLCYLCYTRGKE